MKVIAFPLKLLDESSGFLYNTRAAHAYCAPRIGNIKLKVAFPLAFFSFQQSPSYRTAYRQKIMQRL